MTTILGWDIGGAHLKLALVAEGRVAAIRLEACALWQGLDRLDAAMERGLDGLPRPRRHVVTMTGELTDLFADRAEGVRAILERIAGRTGGAPLALYANDGTFLDGEAARARPDRVASA